MMIREMLIHAIMLLFGKHKVEEKKNMLCVLKLGNLSTFIQRLPLLRGHLVYFPKVSA
jgi:hypothetical protein